MQMKPCDNGHYYDQNKNTSCPYCTPAHKLDVIDRKTEVYQKREISNNEVPKDVTQLLSSDNSAQNELLTVGWIIITQGKRKGKSYVITYGMNSIGRGNNNHIRIDNNDNSISRERHCSIIYDFENKLFFIQHHEGRYLTYLNGELVTTVVPLKNHEKIKIGATEFIFVALCGDDFQWEEYDYKEMKDED